jgi:hypothetical protein
MLYKLKMEVTKIQCDQFRKNPSINPLTGRSIHKGKITHQRLTKACENSTTMKTPSPIIRSDYQVPPMGPMIHFQFKAKSSNYDEVTRKNIIQFLNYFQSRLTVIRNSTKISLMEINDIKNLLVNISNWLNNIPEGMLRNISKLYNGSLKQLELIKDIENDNTKSKINDLPKHNIVADIEVKPNRYFIRGRVLWCFDFYNSTLDSIDTAIIKQEIHETISRGQLKHVLSEKQYLDYLISKKIFTHDDIYKNTFPNDKVYSELKDKYEEYAVLYKKLKGKSP